MAEIKRTKTTTTKTTKTDQTQYVGQSKTAIKPITPPVLPTKPQTDIKPSIAPSSTPVISPAPIKPVNLPATSSTQSDANAASSPAPITSSRPSDIPSSPPSTPRPLDSSPFEPLSPKKIPSDEIPSQPIESPEQSQSTQTPQQKADYDKKIEEELKNKPKVDMGQKDKAKDALENNATKTGAKEVETAAANRFSKAAMKEKSAAAAKAVGQAIKSLGVKVIAAVNGWWLVGCGLLFIVILAGIVIFLSAGLSGLPGKTYPQTAAKTSAEVTNMKTANAAAAGGLSGVTNASGFHKFDYLSDIDKNFVNDGKADSRMLAALKYLSDKHSRIATSYIINTYQDMPAGAVDPESGVARDPQLVSNVSAHKDGLAADISQIDFVYKAKEIATTPCIDTSLGGIISGALTGGATSTTPKMDIVYYSDQGTELLRQSCKGGDVGTDNQPSKEAIPIKVSWQDVKPEVVHIDNTPDESTTVESDVYSKVYQPEARRKVHQVIAELLQFPTDKADETKYKVTQLITFSNDRDVTPFSTTLDKLYGASRPSNFGLFSMPESWAQVHIGY